MKYSVKMIVKHSVETGEVFLEESIILLDADSFDQAYAKAEKYVQENEISGSYENMYGKSVHSEVVSLADCFSVYDDEDVIEVYPSMFKCSDGLSEDTLVALFENSCTRSEMLPLRQWPDPDHPEENGVDQ